MTDADTGAEIKKIVYTLGLDHIAQTVFESGGPAEGETLVFHMDGHGSTRALTDLATAIAAVAGVSQIFHFDAHGNAVGFNPAAAATNILYSGEQFDSRIGQQYLRARYYNSATGTFNRLDPFAGNFNDPQSLHKYLYTHGDPINGVDPSGLFSLVGMLGSMGISSNLRSINMGSVFATAGKIVFKLAWSVAIAHIILKIQMLWQNLVPLNKQKVRADYDYALLASAGYEDADTAAVQKRGWQLRDFILDRTTGFHARLFQRDGETVLAYAGTGTPFLTDFKNNIQQGLFGNAAQYKQAIDEVPGFEQRNGVVIDRFVGHSLGGGLASSAAIVYNRPATTFNAAGVNPSFVEQYGANLAQANQLIDAYRVQGEILSSLQDMSSAWFWFPMFPGPLIGLIGALAPDSTGKTFWLPGKSFSVIQRHLMSDVLSGMQKMM